MRLLLAITLLMVWPPPVQSQQDAPAPLVVPFAQFPPFLFFDDDGQRTGFIVDLAEMLGSEINVPIEYLDVANSRDWIAAQASGQSQLIPGVLKLPPLEATNRFSVEVAADVLRPAVLASDHELIASETLTDKRVAVVPPAVGSDHPILDQNTRVEYKSPQEAIFDLLSDKVDAVLLPPPVVYGLARDAGFDGRITFVGEPLLKSTRHVALHESRAELLPAINDALKRMEADGRLQNLREIYNISVPAPPPDILQVGVTELPPLSVINDDGTFSGFSIEVTQALADRAGLSIEFVPLPIVEWVKGPQANGLDAISALVVNDDRRAAMDFSYPILERVAVVVTDDPSAISATRIADLDGFHIGVVDGSIFARLAAASGVSRVAGYSTVEDAVKAQLSGEIDVAVVAANVARAALERVDQGNQLSVIPLADERIDTAIALRFGLGAVRRQLNAVTPGYLLSDDYAALREKYFGVPIFWTPTRIYGGLGALAALALGLFGFAIWQRHRQQQAELARELAHSKELGRVVHKLETANGELERSNRELDEFAYIASHDLKEPLRGIGINANFLMREELPSQASERVLRMSELAGRMEQLISDLLFFSRLGRGDEAQVPVEPRKMVEGIRSDLSEWLDERGGEIIEGNAIPTLKTDRLKAKTVLQNLIVNGIKYNDSEEKRVEVGFLPSVKVNGQTLENAIYVKDNGIGIGEEYRHKIFRIFSRLNKRSDYDSGTGSGLAFVRKIVENYGGVVDFNSTPGEGSTFYVTLPLANQHM